MFVIRNLMLVVMAMGLTFAAKAQVEPMEQTTDQQDVIPVEINDFVEQHFPAAQIANVEKNDGKYEVKLNGDIELKFNESNEVTSIKSPAELPASVIPNKLRVYASTQHADQQITGWELDNNQQKLTLNDGTELVFDTDGNFVR